MTVLFYAQDNPPESSNSYQLEDIYNRLNEGTAGSQSTFTEPSSGPGTSTMNTLNEIMSIAPSADNTNGALISHVILGKTFWGLRTDGTWGLETGERYLSPVPKTGQNESYRTGDDGDLEAGETWPSPRFTDNSDGTITDNLTGLIWWKQTSITASSWNNAIDYCNLLANNIGGLTDGSSAGDWRLANVKEYFSLLDFSRGNSGQNMLPAGHPFSNTTSQIYWASNTAEWFTTQAYTVGLGTGTVSTQSKINSYRFFAVRQ